MIECQQENNKIQGNITWPPHINCSTLGNVKFWTWINKKYETSLLINLNFQCQWLINKINILRFKYYYFQQLRFVWQTTAYPRQT